MTGIARRELLFAGMLAGFAGIGTIAHPVRPNRPLISQEQLEAGLPDSVLGQSRIPVNDMVLPAQDELSRSIYDGYVVRGYQSGGSPAIYLLAAYGAVQDYALQLHRPEICYASSGYRVESLTETALALPGRTIPGNTMSASLGARRDRVLWWTRVGSAFPTSAWQERGEILKSALHRRIPDGVLLRLSCPEDPGAGATLARFAAALVSACDGRVAQLLVGTGGPQS